MRRATDVVLLNRSATPYFPNLFLNSAVKAGNILNKSPTTPYRASLKIGASASLLIATIVFADRIPAWC